MRFRQAGVDPLQEKLIFSVRLYFLLKWGHFDWSDPFLVSKYYYTEILKMGELCFGKD